LREGGTNIEKVAIKRRTNVDKLCIDINLCKKCIWSKDYGSVVYCPYNKCVEYTQSEHYIGWLKNREEAEQQEKEEREQRKEKRNFKSVEKKGVFTA